MYSDTTGQDLTNQSSHRSWLLKIPLDPAALTGGNRTYAQLTRRAQLGSGGCCLRSVLAAQVLRACSA